MDFLVRMRAIDPIPLPPADLGRLALQQVDYWDRLMAAGKVVYTAPFVGRRARVAIYSVESKVINSIFWGNVGRSFMSTRGFEISYSCVEGQLPQGEGNINQDPLFRYLEREVVPLATNTQLRELYRSIIDADG